MPRHARSRGALPLHLRLPGQTTAVALAALAAAALVVNARLSISNTHAMRDASAWVEHTHQVLEQLQGLLLSLQDAETGQRGYIITGEPSYLTPYEIGVAGVERKLADLTLLARDAPEQQRSLNVLRPLVRSKLDELARTVGLREGPGGAEAARTVVRTDQGKHLMDDIRHDVAEMMARERGLLVVRDHQSSAAARTAVVTSVVGSGAGLALLVSAFLSFRRRSLERGRAAAQLHEEKERFRTTLTSIGDAVIVTDVQGRITMLNPTARAILGWGDDAIGRPLEDVFRIVNELTRQPVESPVRKVLRDGQVVGLANHTVVIRRDGSDVPIDDSGAPVRGHDGVMVGVVLVFRDIRARREAERELQRRAALLQQQDQRKNEFLSVLSHELRNPLTPILNAVTILQMSGATVEQARHAREVIARQVSHMSRLVEDLLDTARIAEGKVRLNRELVSFDDALRRTVDDHRSLFQKKGIALEVHDPPQRLWVEADATRLVQVVGNLLHNAAKFTDPGGHVAVTLAREGDRALLRVRDDGAGMDRATLGKLFQPFMQAENTLARTQGGLGLGLALAKTLVELQGGTVEAFSEGVGRGTEFVVAFPLAQLAGVAERPSRPRPLRIVVIDDNEDATATLREVLELEGHQVVTALDGRSGVEAALAAQPDVVLCDVGLPDLDGFEVARRLRAAGLRSRLIALTGYTQPDDAQRALQAGFDDHLAKPAEPEALMRLLASEPAPEPPRPA